jgi:hypothetical protein
VGAPYPLPQGARKKRRRPFCKSPALMSLPELQCRTPPSPLVGEGGRAPGYCLRQFRGQAPLGRMRGPPHLLILLGAGGGTHPRVIPEGRPNVVRVVCPGPIP